MAFQAGVGLWFAAHLVSETPIGARFGFVDTALPLRIQFETGEFLDDIDVELDDGSRILVQCKTAARVSNGDPALASTVKQLVSLLLNLRSAAPTSTRPVAAILAVPANAQGARAPAALDTLHQACRFFDAGGRWQDAFGKINQDQQGTLLVFAEHARIAWKSLASVALTDDDLADLARLFRVVRFDVEDGGSDYRDAASTLGTQLLGASQAGQIVAATLETVARRLIRSGAPATREGLITMLRSRGIEDTRRPRFENDLARLQDLSRAEANRLGRHARLPIHQDPDQDGGVPIPRECLPALAEAIEGGSLLVIGEPGAGKTGVLVTLAESLLRQKSPFVFISVDRLGGIATSDALREELGLQHHLLDVLTAWPGTAPGVLMIDALDASRGGPSERLFASLIEDGIRRLGDRWSIVASIRTFDLRNGKRFRDLVTGPPPAPAYADDDFPKVRHFRIPRLTDSEIGALAKQGLAVGELAESAPPGVAVLLRNVFNLSLAAELIKQGISPRSIHGIKTQSDLIDRYEDERLDSARLRNAVKAAVAVMVDRRRLTVLKTAVGNDAIDDVLSSGVMAPAGDRIAFAHHVLFDHAASRFFLEWDDPKRLIAQITADPSIGFLLGPSLRFAIERIWRDDEKGRPTIWQLIAEVGANTTADPVIASVALRTAAERVEGAEDVQGLCELIAQGGAGKDLGPTISRLARFVTMSMEETEQVANGAAIAWAKIAKVAVETGQQSFADGSRFILWALAERADLSDAAVASAFGEAARALLAFAWSLDRVAPVLVTNAIRFVCKSYGTDSAASRALLRRILEEPRFSKHAHEEAPWLAEGVPAIAKADPEFVAEIYAALLGRSLTDDAQTWLGGSPSRILPLSSNRAQDYEHARWHLRRAFPALLKLSPALGTQVASGASIAQAMERRSNKSPHRHDIATPLGPLQIIEDDLTLDEWREGRRRNLEPGDDILTAYAQFLREASGDEFRACVEVALVQPSASSLWARLLGVGAERLELVDDLLWPAVSQPEFLSIRGLSRDAIFYLAAIYPSREVEQRQAFESRLLDLCRPADDSTARMRATAARFLSIVSEEFLATKAILELKRDLEALGWLTGNRPLVSTSVSFRAADDIVDHILESDGVDLSHGPDQELRKSTRILEKALGSWGEDAEVESVADLWRAATDTVRAIEGLINDPLHPQSLHAAWGSVSNAVEKIAGAGKAYTPGEHGHPTVAEMLTLLDELAASPYPVAQVDSDDSGDGMMAWGNWDVRVYAASSLIDLAARFGEGQPALVGRLRPFLSDPVPAVRLQIAQSINVLVDIDRTQMWEMFEQVAGVETHPGILGFFISGPLSRLVGTDLDRCEALASAILARQSKKVSTAERQRRNTLEKAFGNLAGWLWVGHGRPVPKSWIDTWVGDITSGEPYLWQLVSDLRESLFVKWRSGDGLADHIAVQERARGVLLAVIEVACRTLNDATTTLVDGQPSAADRAAAEALYRSAESLLDLACNQLYFGSGAFRRQNEEERAGLAAPEAMREFVSEYGPILDLIAQAATPRTLHHLIELYEYVAAAAPEVVFDRIVDLLVGPAAREGYHFESLGSDVLVRLIRRYLADHRGIFEDEARRLQLVQVLELFSSAGWPEALRLLYDLPDLLR